MATRNHKIKQLKEFIRTTKVNLNSLYVKRDIQESYKGDIIVKEPITKESIEIQRRRLFKAKKALRELRKKRYFVKFKDGTPLKEKTPTKYPQNVEYIFQGYETTELKVFYLDGRESLYYSNKGIKRIILEDGVAKTIKEITHRSFYYIKNKLKSWESKEQ